MTAGVAAVPHQQGDCELRKQIPSLAIFCCLNNPQTSLVQGYRHFSLAHMLCHGCRLAVIPLYVSSHMETQLEEQPLCGLCPLLGPSERPSQDTISFKVSAQMQCMSISQSQSRGQPSISWRLRAEGTDPLTGSGEGTIANRHHHQGLLTGF